MAVIPNWRRISCVLTNNNAQLPLGGIMRGGAICNQSGALSLFGCGISNNAATSWNLPISEWFGYGGAIYNANGVVQIVGCNCSGNSCHSIGGLVGNPGGSAMGGGVFQASGALLVTNSTFTLNQALASVDLMPGYGGALCATGGVVIIDHSQFAGNTSAGGG